MDSPNPLLADHFPDPYCVMEEIPFGVEKDQSVDWKETSDEHVIMMDVPGLRKGEIKIGVAENGLLRVIGERKKEDEKKGDRWHKVERMYGKFWRQLRLPENVDLDSIKAEMENGVLTLTLFNNCHMVRSKVLELLARMRRMRNQAVPLNFKISFLILCLV